MASQVRKLRIAMLNADIPVPKVLSSRGSYGNIFVNLLRSAAAKISPDIQIESVDYDVRNGEYPTGLRDWNAIIISGSASSAYEEKPWIQTLNQFIKKAYSCTWLKIYGSCFGHQIICQSLLGSRGVTVEKDPRGYEAGVHEITFTDTFRQAFDQLVSEKYDLSEKCLTPTPVPKTIRLQFVHGDHVRFPTRWESIPFLLVGNTEHCAAQGVYQEGRVFTLQGHFEFDKFVNISTLQYFSEAFNWEPAGVERYLELADADDDAETVALMVLRFFLGHGSNELGAPPLNDDHLFLVSAPGTLTDQSESLTPTHPEVTPYSGQVPC